MGLSLVHDYVHHPKELGNINLYEWIRCYKREKKSKTQKNRAVDTSDMEHESPATDGSPDVSFDVPDHYDIDSDAESNANEESNS